MPVGRASIASSSTPPRTPPSSTRSRATRRTTAPTSTASHARSSTAWRAARTTRGPSQSLPELSIRALHELELGPGALVVALDELQDPQNFGAVIRSSVALGATAVLWPEHRSAPLSMATFRASAGAVEHATLCRVGSLPDALTKLRAAGLTAVGLDANGPDPLSAVDLSGPVVLVVGAEGKGLRRTVKSACDRLARLPMAGPIASLNASVAAAIALYETARQRAASRAEPSASK